MGGGGNVKDYAKQAIRNLLHANSDVHRRILIAEFPKDGIKCLEKLQSHCANMNFAYKSRYDRTFQQVTHKGGESAINYIKIFQNAQDMVFSQYKETLEVLKDYQKMGRGECKRLCKPGHQKPFSCK